MLCNILDVYNVSFGRPRVLSPSGAQRYIHDNQLLSECFVSYLNSDLPGISRSVGLHFQFPKYVLIVIVGVIFR